MPARTFEITNRTRNGKPVLRCKFCGVEIATRVPVEQCYCHCTNEEPPELTLRELWAAFYEALKHFAAGGFELRSHAEAAERLGICRECPSRMYRKPFGIGKLERCAACGCFLRFKTRMATEHCPYRHHPGDPPLVPLNCGSCP